MNIEELKQDFINNGHDGVHQLDRDRFVRYAIASIKEGKELDRSVFQNVKDEERVNDLEIAFEWIKDTLSLLA